MLEIEMKFPVADPTAVAKKLADWQARPDAPATEVDHYFNAPYRDFARTDEALRLRRVGKTNRLTYKGPKLPGPTKTRTEIEVPLAEGDDIARAQELLLEHLGFVEVAVVRKERRGFAFDREGLRLYVCLDEVEHVGSFVEVEIVAPSSDREHAQAVLLQVVEDLGLQGDEKRSYLEMLLERRGGVKSSTAYGRAT